MKAWWRSLLDRLGRPVALLALALAVTVTAMGTFVLVEDDDPEPGASADRAFLDGAATSDLIAVTSDLVNRTFSVDPKQRKKQQRFRADHLATVAQEQFRELYAPYLSKKTAAITLVTTTSGVGVVRLTDDEAEVLVIADQTAVAPDGRSNAGTAQVRLSLTRGSGSWQISSIDPI